MLILLVWNHRMEADVEVNAEKDKYMYMSQQNTQSSYNDIL
jgi:hypothetical protein